MHEPSTAGANAEASLIVARLRLLKTASRALSEAGLDVPRVLTTIADSATDLLADACTITLVSRDGCFIDVATFSDRDADARAMFDAITTSSERLRVDEGLVGEVVRTRRPVFIPAADAQRLASVSAAYREFVLRYPIRSVLVVPLLAHEEVLGTLALMRRDGDPYVLEDLELAVDIANHAGLALENARLYQGAEEARRSAETALERAQAAVRARDNILAIVSHDLRNPLSAIVLSATLLTRGTPTPQRCGDVILRSARRMDRLISDLLDIAQIDAGAFSVEPRPYDLASVLLHAAEVLRPVVAAMEQQLVVTTCEARVPLDRERFLQVVANLVGNASKFSPRGSTIRLEASVEDDEVEVCVIDEGPGIPPEVRVAVFERFVQNADGPSRRLGVGLGLAIARGIVEAHGGTIFADAAPNGGAKFCIRLPRVAPGVPPDGTVVAAFFGVSAEQACALLERAAGDLDWRPGPVPGVTLMPVTPGAPFADATAMLVRIAEGATYPSHTHGSIENLLMLQGGLRDDDGAELWAGDRAQHASGTTHASTALRGGCLLAARVEPSSTRRP